MSFSLNIRTQESLRPTGAGCCGGFCVPGKQAGRLRGSSPRAAQLASTTRTILRTVFAWLTNPFNVLAPVQRIDVARARAVAALLLLLTAFYIQQAFWGPEEPQDLPRAPAFIMMMAYFGVLVAAYIATRLGFYEYAAIGSALMCWLPVLRCLASQPFDTLSAVCRVPREPQYEWLCEHNVDTIVFARNAGWVTFHLLLLVMATTMKRFLIVASVTIAAIAFGSVITVHARHPDVTVDFTHLSEALVYLVVVALLLLVVASVFHHDLYKINQQQTQLVHSERRLAAFVSCTSEAIVICSDSLDIRDCNPSYSRMFRSDSRCHGTAAANLFVSGVVPTGPGVTECRRADGTTFPADVNWIHEADRRALVIRDVSAAIESEKAKSAELEARAASEAKTTALVNLSHELRTPLNTVLGNLQLLQDDCTSAQNVKGCVKAAWKAGTTLLQLLNDLLDVSKLEAGRFELHAVPFDLSELVEDTAEMMYRQAAKKGVELLCFAPPAMPSCVGDPLRLKQVLCNLLGNSIKFTHRGHVYVEVAAAAAPDGNVHITFTIEDSGIGMTEEQTGKLFKRFVQASSAISKDFGGTGLGLAISKQLIELMYGSIDIKSTVGHGSIFTVKLVLPVTTQPVVKLSSLELLAWPSPMDAAFCVVATSNPMETMVIRRHLDLLTVPHEVTATVADAVRVLQTSAAFDIPGIPPPRRIVILDDAFRKQVDAELLKLAAVVCITSETTNSAQDVVPVPKPITHRKLRLALSTSQPAKESLLRISQGKESTTLTVLVCEDNKVNSRMVARMLTNLGHTVVTAFDGLEAVELCKTQSFNVILMDTSMPVMGGEQATRTIRSQPGPNAAVPIISFSADVYPGDIKRCLESGMTDHLAKPVMKAELKAILARWGNSEHVAASSATAQQDADARTCAVTPHS